MIIFQSILSQPQQLDETTEVEYSISSSTSIGFGVGQENAENSSSSSTNHSREALSHEASEHESVSKLYNIVLIYE